MAQSQQPRGEGEAEFVRQIVTDPRNVPDVMRLYGYPGASSEENHDRLYLNPDLSQYVEVPRSAILHRMTASPQQDPNGGVTLWVRRDAALIQKAAPAAQALAQYFAGAIAGTAAAGPQPDPWFAQYAAGAAAAGAVPAAAAAQLLFTQVNICQTRNQPWCPYPTEVCTIAGPACHTRHPPMCGVAAAAAGAGAMPAAAQPALLSPPVVCLHPTLEACQTHYLTRCVPCVTYEIVSCAVACFPTPRGECPVSLAPALCQASPVGFCGGSVGAVCGAGGSIACGGSVACGGGVGPVAGPAQAAVFFASRFCSPGCGGGGGTPGFGCHFTVPPNCPPLSAFCQATPVEGCGGSIGAVCGLQGSVACGASVACGPGFGQGAGPAQAAAFFASRFCSVDGCGGGGGGGGGSLGCTPGFGCHFTVPPNCPPLSALCQAAAPGFGQAGLAAAAVAPQAAPFFTAGFGCPWTVPPNCPPHTFQAGCTQVPVICHCIQTVQP